MVRKGVFLGRGVCGADKKDEQTFGKFRGSLISNCVAIFGTPYIVITDKDTRFNGSMFRIFSMGVILLSKLLSLDIIKVLEHQSEAIGI